MSASLTYLDVAFLSLVEGAVRMASFQFFSGNDFICSCRFCVSMGGSKFQLFLCHHLGSPPKFLFHIKCFTLDTQG